jgi:uncharacterized protein YdcH (DUF465 family)
MIDDVDYRINKLKSSTGLGNAAAIQRLTKERLALEEKHAELFERMNRKPKPE